MKALPPLATFFLCSSVVYNSFSPSFAESPSPEQKAVTATPQTATLKMSFKIKTLPPPPRRLARPVCGGLIPVDESLVVNRTNHGIQNVILAIYTGRHGTQLPEMELEPETVTMEVRNCRIEPHAVIAKAGDQIKVINRGPFGHALNFQFFNNSYRTFAPPPPLLADFKLDYPEPAPIPIACNIHPWSQAYLLVLDHPFGAVSDENGAVVIRGLPANKKLIFRAYHERGRFSDPPGLEFRGEKTTWRASKFSLTLKPGENELGDVVVDW